MQEQRLNLRQEQKQIMTPAQIQSLQLLSLAVQELQAYIGEQLLENPVLELAEAREAKEEADWRQPEPPGPAEEGDSGWQEPEIGQTSYEDWGYGSGGALLREAVAEQGGLSQQLLLQAAFLPNQKEAARAVRAIILALDSDGYLRVSLEELAIVLGLDPGLLETALAQVQTLEPRGVGARDLKECLRLQVAAEEPGRELLLRLIEDFLPQLAAGERKAAARACGVSETLVAQAYDRIRAMSPRPGAGLNGGGQVQYIVADVSVNLEQGQLSIIWNDNFSPRLNISPYYAELYTAPGNDQELTGYLRQRLAAARVLIRNVERRRETLSRIAAIVFSWQLGFFTQGAAGLKPLSMKQVATEAGLHESTVSRAVAGKYVATPRGLLPWKFFFPAALSTSGGGAIANTEAKAMIAALISGEDRAHPLSDEKLSQLLRAQGLVIARRTVAKYREALGLPGQAGRRRNPNY